MKEVTPESQNYINILLNGSENARHKIKDSFKDLPDKKDVSDNLIEYLKDEQDGNTRSWIMTALANINDPDAVQVVADHIDPEKEDYQWTRFFALQGINMMQPKDLKVYLEKAQNDPSDNVRAASYRLLIENGFEDGYLEKLIKMLKNQKEWFERYSACKALRGDSGIRPLGPRVERLIISELVGLLQNEDEFSDIRYQAASALGDIKYETDQAINALEETLKQPIGDLLRRACVDTLIRTEKPKVKWILLKSLIDEDAEIRVRAARGLKFILGSSEAVSFLVEEILQEEASDAYFFDALRVIDGKEAAKLFIENLLHPDPKISDRSSKALTILGGEDAVRTLQTQRSRTMETYSQLLKEADEKIMEQFTNLMGRAHKAFSLSMWMHGTIFVLGIVVLVVSLYVAFSNGFDEFQRYLGIGAAGSSLGTLLWLFYKDPLNNIHESVNRLMKANIVFLGYVRQINQIDATFKHMYFELSEFSIDQMKETVEQIQNTIRETLTQVKLHFTYEEKEEQTQHNNTD